MTRTSPLRAAFTLIELLVVIAIIAVLVSLTTAGVMTYLKKIPDIQTRNEMTNFSNGLAAFHNKYGIYPPSRIYLANNLAEYSAADPHPVAGANSLAFRQRSLQIIKTMWPRMTFAGCNWMAPNSPPAGWRGVVLEGDQCLVFFLTGMNGTGFSTNPVNPTALFGNRVLFVENLQSARLANLHGNASFLSYLDPYYNLSGNPKPYLYFSSTMQPNTLTNDCPTIAPTTTPYSNPANSRFYNADSFQIICAGRDHRFGPGGPWSTQTAGLIAVDGKDDITNFHGSIMGAGD